ncbi:uncharacterized protein LOC126895214 [Daktulosphaira vitifoliae]|uniref:uncharacterized protein LOC126895214 n=1 Tax=Daktulosphaira vitifoliae TaxID=58002 RepID=UPI0021AB01FA|nr:uncharacterized protein LOC126895214 [Daktulosphaira vitifoliae]
MTLVISGATKVTVSKLSVNLSDLTGSVSMEFPDLNVSTLYDMDTDVMNSMTLKGVGHCNATISNLKVNLTGRAELTSKDMNGKTYLKLTHVKITMLIGDAVGRLVDSSNDEENIMLTEAANTFYDINRAEMLEMFTPIAEEIAEALVTELGGQVLSSLPYNEMFVD